MAAEEVVRNELACSARHLQGYCGQLHHVALGYLQAAVATSFYNTEGLLRAKYVCYALKALVIMKTQGAPESIFKNLAAIPQILRMKEYKDELMDKLTRTDSLLYFRDFTKKDITLEDVDNATSDLSLFASGKGLLPDQIVLAKDFYCLRVYEHGQLMGYDTNAKSLSDEAKTLVVTNIKMGKKTRSLRPFREDDLHKRLALPFRYVLSDISANSEDESTSLRRKEGIRMMLSSLSGEIIPATEPFLRQTLKDLKLVKENDLVVIFAAMAVLRPNYRWRNVPPTSLRDTASLLLNEHGEAMKYYSAPENVPSGELFHDGGAGAGGPGVSGVRAAKNGAARVREQAGRGGEGLPQQKRRRN